MKTINQGLLMLTSVVLIASCTGQSPPVTPTVAANTTPVVANTLATSESFPLVATPQTTVIPVTATSTSEPNPAPTAAASVDVSSPVALIPNTGALPTPTVSKKKNKFENFSVPVSGESAFFLIPVTGFPKGILTVIEPQPSDKKYSTTDVTLEIPSLGIKLPVMGVPKKDGTWDVSWLSDQAGWLEGTAFPSWSGNSVLTAHFYMASGFPGPFVNLSTLKYGDKIFVHAFGQKNIFEVQTNEDVEPNDQSVLKHEEKSWLTLITCAEYVAETATYKKRTVVRAVLVAVETP